MDILLPIILYEGEEDKSFLLELLKSLGLNERFEFFEKCGGKDKFKKILKGLVIPNRKAIIIVADNDGDPVESFKNIQTQIGEAGFTIPLKQRETVETANLPPLSVLMIPWDNDAGCLETLCLSAINPKYKHQLEVCAEGLAKCAGAEKWPVAKRAKLRMRGFLSAVCQSDPNTGLRYAWSTDERPGDIFPLKGVAAYNQIAEFFKNFAA
jgi:hypothetical protein